MTRLDSIRTRLLTPPPTGLPALALGGAAVAAPTLIRLSIDQIVSETTFVTYYPFVVFSAMFLGWRHAALVTFASALAANFLFMHPRYSIFAGMADTVGVIFFVIASALVIFLSETLRRTLEEVDAGRKRETHLNLELQHRVKNTLTVVQGLALQTFRQAPGAQEALTTYQGRLRALADAHDILNSGRWEACRLPELAVRALEPFTRLGAVNLYGPACALRDDGCVPLVLALHELGTNAVKYGALSTPDGCVDVAWGIIGDSDAENAELVLEWVERGGPAVLAPTRRGLGSRLLRAQPGLKDVRLEFRPEGVTCRIQVTGARLLPEDADPLPQAAPATLYTTAAPASA